MAASPDRPGRAEWVSLGEASKLLGIAPGTLRRWADDGRISVFTTPGGHRRFSRTTLRSLLPVDRTQRPQLARLASPERLARAYRPGRRQTRAVQSPGFERLSEPDRLAFRERGRRLVGLLIEYLDAANSQTRSLKLQEAARLAADEGRQAAVVGASMSEAVGGALRFRAPFMAELAPVARRRRLDTR